mmetsp:Transcript_465/g.889  ORF Transcript_465/g.889 Transcript_465/m.889 type:complete len:110 (+) Transcript_465:562-891(+)
MVRVDDTSSKFGTAVRRVWNPYARVTKNVLKKTSCARPMMEANIIKSMFRTRPWSDANCSLSRRSIAASANEVPCQYMGPQRKLMIESEAPIANPSLGPLNGGKTSLPV